MSAPEPSSIRHSNGEVTATDQEKKRTQIRHVVLGGTGILLLSLVVGNVIPITENVRAATTFNTENDRVSEIASKLNGSDVRVDCNTAALNNVEVKSETGRPLEVEGVVNSLNFLVSPVALPVITLREQVCQKIISFDISTDTSSFSDQEEFQYEQNLSDYATSLSILLHEEEHTHQVFSESAATCYAFQKLPAALAKLGMRKDAAQVIAQNTADRVAPMLEPSYLSEECRPGGAMDLRISETYIRPPLPNDVASTISPSN